MSDRINAYMYDLYRRLRDWRRHVALVAEAARSVVGAAEVYVFGGAAEDRLTALSDIDVAVVLPRDPEPGERLRLKLAIMSRAFDAGLPHDYPIELHVIGPSALAKLRKNARLIRIR